MEEKVKEVVAFMNEKGVTKDVLDAYFDNMLKTEFRFVVDGVFNIRGPIVIGKVETGCLYEGMDLVLEDVSNNIFIKCRCIRIEKQRIFVDSCKKGDRVAIRIYGPSYEDIKRGMVLVFDKDVTKK